MELLITILILAIIYFLPTLVSFVRKSQDTKPIFILNFLLGFTGIFWVFSLIWAIRSSAEAHF